MNASCRLSLSRTSLSLSRTSLSRTSLSRTSRATTRLDHAPGHQGRGPHDPALASSACRDSRAAGPRCPWTSAAPGQALPLDKRCPWTSAAPGQALPLDKRCPWTRPRRTTRAAPRAPHHARRTSAQRSRASLDTCVEGRVGPLPLPLREPAPAPSPDRP
jgi:hypothetical protein